MPLHQARRNRKLNCPPTTSHRPPTDRSRTLYRENPAGTPPERPRLGLRIRPTAFVERPPTQVPSSSSWWPSGPLRSAELTPRRPVPPRPGRGRAYRSCFVTESAAPSSRARSYPEHRTRPGGETAITVARGQRDPATVGGQPESGPCTLRFAAEGRGHRVHV